MVAMPLLMWRVVTVRAERGWHAAPRAGADRSLGFRFLCYFGSE